MSSERAANVRYSDAPRLSRRQRWRVLVLVALLHLVAIWAIVRGLGGVSAVLDDVGLAPRVAAYDVSLPKTEPSPTATTKEAEGAAAAAATTARPKEIAATRARIPNKAVVAAPAASAGNDIRSGASTSGIGTGGGGQGIGTGSGGGGNGQGGAYVASRAVKTAGDIKSAKDYPRQTRDERIGTSVVIVLVVGTDGRVHGCTVRRPSGDPQADAITCRLATERFHFRPARDQDGNPIESLFGWEQRWFAP